MLPGAGEGLRRLYGEYRRREATALLSLIPREAVRPLYRLARERSGGVEAPADPMAILVDYVERELLPLPPFHVWLRDFQAHRQAHLEGLEAHPVGPAPEAPVAVEIRSFRHQGEEWYATLHLFRRDGVWRGFIRFSAGEEGEETARTADIFREEDAATLRDRFHAFGTDALQAFLRSSLP